MRLRRIAIVFACLAVALPAMAAQSPVTESERGERSVADALRSLQGPTLQFLFSDALLPPNLKAPPMTPSSDPLTTARALLGPHGLALRQVGPGLYAVVAAAAVTRPASPEAGAAGEDVLLGEVVVTASRYRIGAPDNALTLDAPDLTGNPGPGDDPIRAIARLPGIASDGISARPFVRGGDADEVLMLLDGFPLRRAFHLASYQSLFSVIDAGVVRSIDVYSGGFPARYGNRMSGVFDIRTRATDEAPARAIGVDFFNASAYTSGATPALDGQYLASARIGTLSPLLGAFAPSVGDPRYADAYARVGRGAGTRFSWSGNLLWARDELGISDRISGERAELEDRSRYLWLRADFRPAPSLTLTGLAGQSVVESRREGVVDNPGIANGFVADRRDSTLWDLRAQLAWQPGERSRLEAGAEVTFEDGRYDYAADAAFTAPVAALLSRPAMLQRRLQLSPSRSRSALFVAQRLRVLQAVTADVGLRAQSVDTAGDDSSWRFEPRMALGWEITPLTSAHFSWGIFRQEDEVHELKVEDALTDFPNAQRSEHFIVGLRHDAGNGLTWRAELFSKRHSDPRPRFENLFSRRTILPEIAPDRVQVLPQFAELRGVELSGEWRGSAWETWMTLGWSEALDETVGLHTRRSWDTALSGSAGVHWRRGPWDAHAALTLRRGLPTTILETTAAGVALGPRNGANLPGFRQLDLRIEYEQPLQSGQLRYSFELINTTNQQNPCCAQLVLMPGSLALRRQRGLPLFPSLGIRWSW